MRAVAPPARVPLPPRQPPPPRRAAPPPRGILDHYRRENGLAVDDAPASDASPGARAVEAAGDVCSVGCVGEIDTPADLARAVAGAGPDALVIVDYYKTACGACRYVARAYEKLCKTSGLPDPFHPHPAVVFLKHNVLDDEDGRTELADAEAVRAVPTFALYRGGERVATLSTRDRAAVAAAINEASGFEWLH